MNSDRLWAPHRPRWALPLPAVTRRHFLLLTAITSAVAAARPGNASNSDPLDPDASLDERPLRQTTSWSVDGLPEIQAMAPRIKDTLESTAIDLMFHGRRVHGNSAGHLYAPIFVRDMATIQPAVPYFLAENFSRTPVEGFLVSQDQFAANPRTRGAVAATLNIEGIVDKATAVSDEETSVVHAASAYFKAFGGTEWLASDLEGRSVIDRIGDALAYVWRERRWGTTNLLFRGHTTDWGDVKREAGPEPTDLTVNDELTASPFDQAWHYRALHDYASMLESLGRGDEAATHYERAALVRADTREELWQPTRGHYRIHHHLRNGLRSRFDEDVIVPISSVLSLFAGLAMPDQVPAILNASARAEEQSGTNRSGISLTPPYPDDFFKSRHMPAWQYQNGGVWDWWGGLQIVSEFEHGQSDRAIAHLTAASQAWENADGIHEWYHIPSHSSQGSDDFAGAAGTMAQAVIRGLFGVDITTNRFQLIPRLGNRNGRLLATRPDGSTLEIAQTVYPSLLFLDIRTNLPTIGAVALRLPNGWSDVIAFVDGRPIEPTMWRIGSDDYIGGWSISTGTHSVIVARTS